jgi:hypothetical protein
VATAEAQKEPLGNKEYEKELKRLHASSSSCSMGRAQGLKVCIVFEGRDGAGKGGTIKAITERVSPRVFRVVALPAPTEREKTRCTSSATSAPAARRRDRHLRSQLVQPRRRRARDGLLHAEAGRSFLSACRCRARDRRVGDHPAQVLARGQPGRADAAPRDAHRRRPQGLEALADGLEVVRSLGRLHPGARRHVRGHGYRVGALVRRPLRGQEARSIERHQPLLEMVPHKTAPSDKVKLPKRKVGRYKAADYPFKYVPEKF